MIFIFNCIIFSWSLKSRLNEIFVILNNFFHLYITQADIVRAIADVVSARAAVGES